MPRYVFHCAKCDRDFELVISVSEYEKRDFSCPHCQGKQVERVFSAMQVVTSKKS